jgi:lysophospholipase L1-like esterase
MVSRSVAIDFFFVPGGSIYLYKGICMARKFRWILSAFFLVYGIITLDFESWKWGVLGISLLSLPLLLQTIKSKDVNIWALWGGFFLVLQSVISPSFGNSDYVTLQPNLHEIINVRGGVPGISGIQNITTDSKGFRTTKNIDYRSNQSYRIFALGGSTTGEDNLDDNNTWTHILQEQLSRKTRLNVEVVNTGVSGTRAKNHLATLRRIIRMKPDLVIFLLGINDWNHFITETFSKNSHHILSALLEFRKAICLRNSMLGKVLGWVYYSVKNTIKYQKTVIQEDYGEYYARQRNSLNRATKYSFHPVEVSSDYKEQLLKISAICHENKIRCIFITQPTGYRIGASEDFKKGFWMTPPDQAFTLDFESLVDIASLYNSFLIQFAREHFHDVCDAASKLDGSYDNFFDDCHLNTEGSHKLGVIVSDCVEKYVKEIK